MSSVWWLRRAVSWRRDRHPGLPADMGQQVAPDLRRHRQAMCAASGQHDRPMAELHRRELVIMLISLRLCEDEIERVVRALGPSANTDTQMPAVAWISRQNKRRPPLRRG